MEAIKRSGYKPTSKLMDIFGFNTHQNPEVKIKDIDTLKRLSPFTREREYNNVSYDEIKHPKFGWLTENQMFNHLRNPEAIKNESSSNDSYFSGKPVGKSEQRTMMVNAAKFNNYQGKRGINKLRGMMGYNKRKINKIADTYSNLNFSDIK